MCRIRLGGSGACSPRKNFGNFDALRWLLSPFLGLKTSLVSIHFRQHAWRFVSSGIGSFRLHPLNRAKKQHTKASHYFVIFFRAMPIKNVWPSYSQSGCSQVSAVLFYARTAKFNQAQVCVGDMCVSHLQARVNNIISVKTLVQQLLGLPDLSPRVIHVEAVLVHPTHPVCVVACTGEA